MERLLIFFFLKNSKPVNNNAPPGGLVMLGFAHGCFKLIIYKPFQASTDAPTHAASFSLTGVPSYTAAVTAATALCPECSAAV